MTDNIVGLDGKPVAPPAKTSPVIIGLLEQLLREARDGHIAGIAVATLNGHRVGTTEHWKEPGYDTELLGVVEVLKYRMIAFQLQG